MAGRREHAERDGRRHHEATGQQRERQRDLQPGEDEARDGHVVLDGPAEIAAEGMPDPVGVLDRERAVEPHGFPQPGGGLGAPLGTDDDERGITGQDVDDDENQDRDEEEGGQERRHPPQEVTPHPGTRRELAGGSKRSSCEAAPEGRTRGVLPVRSTSARRPRTGRTTGPAGPSRCPSRPSWPPPGAGACTATRRGPRRPASAASSRRAPAASCRPP